MHPHLLRSSASHAATRFTIILQLLLVPTLRLHQERKRPKTLPESAGGRFTTLRQVYCFQHETFQTASSLRKQSQRHKSKAAFLWGNSLHIHHGSNLAYFHRAHQVPDSELHRAILDTSKSCTRHSRGLAMLPERPTKPEQLGSLWEATRANPTQSMPMWTTENRNRIALR